VVELVPFAYVVILAWGAVWGSFLNVVIYRVPAGMSVVSPPSRCPSCETPIKWWQNVPVLSFAWLGGRCGSCRTPISIRYPAVEGATAVVALAIAMPWVTAWARGEIGPEAAAAGILAEHLFAYAMISIALIDADTFMIPDSLSLPLPIIGIAVAFGLGDARGVSWQQAAAGAAAGGFGLLAIQWGYAALTGREGLGTGDVKLLAGLGAWLGLQSMPFVMFLAAIQGLLFAAFAAMIGPSLTEERGLASMRHVALPFGPFLVLAGLQWLLLNRQMMAVLGPWLDI
jgi:leader peptidase (prepilin peptidase) / N-methyltransferase